MPASARSDPANSAVVPGTRDRISWPVISASRVSTTVRCDPMRAASTGAARPITANDSVGSDSSTPVVAAGRPVADRSSGMTAPSALTTGRRLTASSRIAVPTSHRDVSRAGWVTRRG
jgi:hypothetical protein